MVQSVLLLAPWFPTMGSPADDTIPLPAMLFLFSGSIFLINLLR